MILRFSKNVLTKILLISLGLYCHISDAQNEAKEQVVVNWGKCLDNAQLALHLNDEDFSLFYRFEGANLDKLRAQFMREAGTKKIDSSILSAQVKEIVSLHDQFKKTEAEYPSSVNEYRKGNQHRAMAICDTSGCDNIGFENGNLGGWNAYYAYNFNTGSFNYFNITNITGGPAGAVTQAANDTLTSTNGFYNVVLGPNARPDYMVSVVSGTVKDALVPGLFRGFSLWRKIFSNAW